MASLWPKPEEEMAKKLLDFQDVLKEELKDKEFKKFYEEEGRRLALGYKIAN